MADRESLFSLEVIVESVENIVVSSHTPAIAFRLLDFPTLVIRSEETVESTSLGSYKFNAGKSCLFKINKEKLYARLHSTPLYIMLVDIWGRKTKLLASATISLSKCFENVWQSIERNGIDVPVVLGNKGVFELFNLLGTPVAIVRLSYRIFSLGGTINGHVNIHKPLVKSPCQPLENTRSEKDLSKQNQRSTIDETLIVTQNSSQKLENQLSILQLEVETQTDFSNKEPSMKSNNKQNRLPKSTNGKDNVNIARPPPLYYNSQSSFIDSFIPVNSKSLGTPEKRNYTVNREEAMPRECYQTVSVQTTNELAEVSDYASKVHPERAQVSDIPLINALLNELSLAKQNWMNTAAQLEQCHDSNEVPVAVNSQELPMVLSQTETKPLKCGVKNKMHQSKGKIKQNTTVKLPPKGVLVRRNQMKFKKSLLKCGTTKTQKLREAFFNKKTASNITFNAERKRPQSNVEKGENLVASKNEETKDIACQTEIINYVHKNRQEKETDINSTQLRQALEVRDVGIQVINPDDNLFQRGQKDELSDEENRNLFDTNTSENYPLQVGESYDKIQEDPNKMSDLKAPEYEEEDSPAASEVGSSFHSMSCTGQELVSVKQAFSNFPPPIRKNSRYRNDKHPSVSEEHKSSSIDSTGSSKKNGLLGKTYSHSKSLSNSSFEHNYSCDNFDSFTSDHEVAESNTEMRHERKC